VDLGEHLFWFALSFQTPADVLGMDEVSGACREKGFCSAEFETYHLWLGGVDFVFVEREEEDVFTLKTLVNLASG
jgi:hypothetical protein